MSGFSGKLKDERDIYIPHWPVDTALENLGKAGQLLGVQNIIRISELNIPAVIVALSQAEDPANAALLVKYFVCEARIDNEKMTPAIYATKLKGNLEQVAELFAMVVHAQYASFFESGLAKENSPES